MAEEEGCHEVFFSLWEKGLGKSVGERGERDVHGCNLPRETGLLRRSI